MASRVPAISGRLCGDPARRRFALRRDGRLFQVGWSDTTEFIGTGAASMQGAEVCVKGRITANDFLAQSVVAA